MIMGLQKHLLRFLNSFVITFDFTLFTIFHIIFPKSLKLKLSLKHKSSLKQNITDKCSKNCKTFTV